LIVTEVSESANSFSCSTSSAKDGAQPLYDTDMKIIFTEGSIHHLKTMEMQTAPRVGEEVVVDNHIWKVDSITHFPKENGLNDNKDRCGWDDERDADLTVHLAETE
jgi:hypothetical protein